jgi:hypothetical protein
VGRYLRGIKTASGRYFDLVEELIRRITKQNKKKKSSGIKSGDLLGRAIAILLPIQQPGVV